VTRAEALALLGLVEGFDTLDLRRARRLALLECHPDHGGSREAVDAVERAVETLLDVSSGTQEVETLRVRRGTDRPSFTVNALPVEAFELLLLAAAELGVVADDDPPYRLEVRMHEPRDMWVSFEVVPDAGSSTVSMAIEGRSAFDIEGIRDVWVSAINASQLP
jgi:hypothetical protein